MTTPAFEQGELEFLAPVIPIRRTDTRDDATIQERFEAFHAANPWVHDMLVQLTRDLVAKGHKRVGMKMLFEVVRWQYARAAISETAFAIDNNMTSRYARLLMQEYPEWEGVFETRNLRAA